MLSDNEKGSAEYWRRSRCEQVVQEKLNVVNELKHADIGPRVLRERTSRPYCRQTGSQHSHLVLHKATLVLWFSMIPLCPNLTSATR